MSVESNTVLATLSPIQDEAIRQLVMLDGRTWTSVANQFGISVEEARDAYRRAFAVCQSRQGSSTEAWRESLVEACMDVASQAQDAFTRSKKVKVKKVFKDTPQGTIEERHIESSVGDPRFLNARLNAIQAIAGMAVPKEINLNTRSEHDITVRMENLSDDELEKLASIAQMERAGVLLVDHKVPDVVPVDCEVVSESEPSDAMPSDVSGDGERTGEAAAPF
jgi:hypothetical protein